MRSRAHAWIVFAATWVAACSSGGGGASSRDAAGEASRSHDGGAASAEAPAIDTASVLADAQPAVDVAADVGLVLDVLVVDMPAEQGEAARTADASDGPIDVAQDAAADRASDLPGKDVAQDVVQDTAPDRRDDAPTVIAEAGAVDFAPSGEAGPPPDQCAGLARGLTLRKLALYQAVEVPLMQDGIAVATAQRTAAVVLGRAALARVFVQLGSDWVAREIAVRLHLTSAGRETVLSARKTLQVDSQAGSLDSTVQIDVGGDLVAADTRYWVEAVECGGSSSGALARPRFPESGDVALDGRPTGKLRVAFVPIRFGELRPDTSDAAIAGYRNYLAAMYPTTEVVTSVVDGFSYTPSLGPWSDAAADYITDLLDWTTAQRSYDNPADDVYYYGLFRPAASFDEACGNHDCVDGTGYVVTDPGRFGASLRVAVSFAFADETSAQTIAHELGHNHGRQHAPCDDPNNPDLAFPYAGGSIGVWGYDRRDGSLKDPAKVTDIMGYCKPAWVSDYTYQGFLERIAALNGVVAADIHRTARQVASWRAFWLQGSNVRWATARLMAAPTGTTAKARILDATGNPMDRVDVYLQQVSLPDTVLVLVPEPQNGWHAVELPGHPPLAFEPF